MPTYEIRVRDEAGAVTRITDLKQDNDAAAIAESSREWSARRGGSLELWQGDRCVMVGYLTAAEPALADALA